MGAELALLCGFFVPWAIAGAILMNLPKKSSPSAEALARQLRRDLDEFLLVRKQERQRLYDRLREIERR